MSVAGSSNILGNPISFFSNLGTGIYDFFTEPLSNLVDHPEEFGSGLIQGTNSLLQHSMFGIADTTSKLASTVSKGKFHSFKMIFFF
jgi:vacuolar protein sorting-associated protein 13A/C